MKMSLRLATAFVVATCARATTPHMHACDGSAQTGAAVAATCADFCAGKCSFYNKSSALPIDQAKPLNMTLYRITPKHVLGIANRNTGDAPGDVGFFLSRKTLAAECAKDPGNIRCFLNGINIFGKFKVEVDGGFGPYHMCNPTQGEDDTDSANWKCYQYCETPPKCAPWKDQAQSADWHGPDCYCKNGRGNRTVGRVHRTPHHSGGPAPAWWPQKQCGAVGLAPAGGYCINGTGYQTLKGATPAQCCAACKPDKCDAWAMADGLGADGKGDCQLMKDPMQYHRISDPHSKCLSAYKDSHSGAGYINGGVLGGYWYSTPAAGECEGGARPGDGSGCTWRTVEVDKYTNATCVTAKVDAAVEKYNAPCFGACPGGVSNSTSQCYLACYAEAVNGNPGKIKKMPEDQVTGPWIRAQEEDDPAKGGCPALHPTV